MSIIYFNVKGSTGGGGPVTFVYKTVRELQKRGHNVIYDKPSRADIALCIIESGKTLRKVNREKTKVAVRLDGAYFKEYWHGGPGRLWRPDMTALHRAIERDVAQVDVMIYQSHFSKELIDGEIARRDSKFKIIHNGVDTNLFKPVQRKQDGFINLMHLGKMRDAYLMESLVGVYDILRKKGYKVALILAGTMDGHCANVIAPYKNDRNVRYLGQKPNTALTNIYAHGDIFLGPRQGSSSDNVIAEAQSCGLPVVIPSWGGNVDMVKDKDTGIIVSTGHWDYGKEYIEKLANGVEYIIKDLPAYGKRARTHALQNLTIEKMVDKYLKALGV